MLGGEQDLDGVPGSWRPRKIALVDTNMGYLKYLNQVKAFISG